MPILARPSVMRMSDFSERAHERSSFPRMIASQIFVPEVSLRDWSIVSGDVACTRFLRLSRSVVGGVSTKDFPAKTM